MANEQNLMPIQEVNAKRTPEERKEFARKAGIESGKKRRERKTMREILEQMLKEHPKDSSGKESPLTYEQMITLGLMKGAVRGNSKNYETICAMLDQKPAEKLEITQPPSINIERPDNGGKSV